MLKYKILIRRGLKFSIVGLSGVLVGLVTLYILVEFFHFNKYVAWFPAAFLSILNNFIWNNLFTWSEQKARGREFFRKMTLFYILTFISLGLNYSVYYLLLGINLYYLYAALAGIVSATGLNFVFSNSIIWRVKD